MKLFAAAAVPLGPRFGPVSDGTAREQLRIARLGEEFQWSEPRKQYPVSTHVAVAIWHHVVDGDGVGVFMALVKSLVQKLIGGLGSGWLSVGVDDHFTVA
ncbi:hypothetical protein MUN81_22325 (plasmid) [Hymenobacter sp. 5317J-9]|uniref:hypothetical protein n=1 Tax=Hymenobacter sp. 5317J-9 TaxID=2932250 RepID=UPI001FD714C5|nr:hypothetical protein [Hymenobacter sp. 5317J-9]UOR00126.1 hypothetical protein MUN81_22325 [Hymenobacter sp. 5317J-9]